MDKQIKVGDRGNGINVHYKVKGYQLSRGLDSLRKKNQ